MTSTPLIFKALEWNSVALSCCSFQPIASKSARQVSGCQETWPPTLFSGLLTADPSWQTWSDATDLNISVQAACPHQPTDTWVESAPGSSGAIWHCVHPCRRVMADPSLTSPSGTPLRSPNTSLALSFPFLRERSRVWEDGKEQQLPRDLPSPLPTKRTRTYSA